MPWCRSTRRRKSRRGRLCIRRSAALVDGEGGGGRRLESRDATTNASTSAVDLVVETRGSASLRLGEAHRVGERDRGDGVVSIVGFVDRVDAPSATLATESQTIMFFDDSPVRALMAMLALKDAVAIVRGDARRFHQLAVLEPLTCSSFSVTSFKTMARVDAVDDDDDDDDGKAVETPTRADAMASTTGRELDALMARGSALVSLENVRALLARMRERRRARDDSRRRLCRRRRRRRRKRRKIRWH